MVSVARVVVISGVVVVVSAAIVLVISGALVVSGADVVVVDSDDTGALVEVSAVDPAVDGISVVVVSPPANSLALAVDGADVVDTEATTVVVALVGEAVVVGALVGASVDASPVVVSVGATVVVCEEVVVVGAAVVVVGVFNLSACQAAAFCAKSVDALWRASYNLFVAASRADATFVLSSFNLVMKELN